MSLAQNPFLKALAFSAALHGMTVGSLEALSGLWKRSPQDWIPQGDRLAGGETPAAPPEEASLIWMPADSAKSDEIERITVTPKAMKKTTVAKQAPSPGDTIVAQPGSTASREAVELLRQRVSANLHQVIREEWDRELRQNLAEDTIDSRRVFLKLEWAPGMASLDSVEWMPANRIPGDLRKRIESRLRNELFASSFTDGLTAGEKEALGSIPRRLVLPVKFRRVQ